jgi:hypothetical protein
VSHEPKKVRSLLILALPSLRYFIAGKFTEPFNPAGWVMVFAVSQTESREEAQSSRECRGANGTGAG